MLLPGLVDTHVHVNEPGRTEWEGFATATRAAAAGGVTTIVDMPLNSIPPTTTLAGLEAKRAVAEGQVRVDVGFWGGAVPGNVPDLEPLHEAGVFGFKCFLLDSGVEEFGHLEPEEFALAMKETARIGALMIVHAEDGDLLEEERARRRQLRRVPRVPPRGGGGVGDRAGDRRRPSPTRWPGPRRAPERCADAAPRCTRPARPGVDVSVETCPHYLTFDAEHIPDGATELKCCPPIREADNREALWAALAAGDIDFVVSDHSPCTASLKERGGGDFGQAWGGIASVQLGLPAVWTGARDRGHSLVDVVALDGERPGRPGRARAQGPDRGGRGRRPGPVRPRRGVHGRRGPAAPPQPGLGLRRPPARRRRAGDLAARRTGVRGCCPGTTAATRRAMSYR